MNTMMKITLTQSKTKTDFGGIIPTKPEKIFFATLLWACGTQHPPLNEKKLRVVIWHLFGDLRQSETLSETKPPLVSTKDTIYTKLILMPWIDDKLGHTSSGLTEISNIIAKILITFANYHCLLWIGPIARLVEHWTHELGFMSSNPTGGLVIFHLSLLISLNNLCIWFWSLPPWKILFYIWCNWSGLDLPLLIKTSKL